MDGLFRTPDLGLPHGTRVTVSWMQAEVLEATADRPATRVRFDFDVPVESDELVWAYWKDGSYAALDLPPVGDRRTLPGSSLFEEVMR